MGKDNAGPAFPSQIRNDGEKPIVGFLHEEIHAGTTSNYAGMYLRDYFAAKASDGDVNRFLIDTAEVELISASPDGPKMKNYIHTITRQQARYLHADAMLAERAK